MPQFAWTRALNEVRIWVLVEIIPQLNQVCVLWLLEQGLELAPGELTSGADDGGAFAGGIIVELQARAIRECSSSLVLCDRMEYD